jgi:hypothetical protein
VNRLLVDVGSSCIVGAKKSSDPIRQRKEDDLEHMLGTNVRDLSRGPHPSRKLYNGSPLDSSEIDEASALS